MHEIRRAVTGDFPIVGRDGKTYLSRGLNPDFVHGKISLRELAEQAGISAAFYIDKQPKNSLVWPEDDYRNYCLLKRLDCEWLRYAEYAPKSDKRASIMRAEFDAQHLKVYGMTKDER